MSQLTPAFTLWTPESAPESGGEPVPKLRVVAVQPHQMRRACHTKELRSERSRVTAVHDLHEGITLCPSNQRRSRLPEDRPLAIPEESTRPAAVDPRRNVVLLCLLRPVMDLPPDTGLRWPAEVAEPPVVDAASDDALPAATTYGGCVQSLRAQAGRR
jgi:hypothetical protein